MERSPAGKYFPAALHTVDVVHVLEYIYQAGECLHKEGSAELQDWVNDQKELLYNGKESLIVTRCKRHYNALPATGPGNKGRRERLWSAPGLDVWKCPVQRARRLC